MRLTMAYWDLDMLNLNRLFWLTYVGEPKRN